MTGTRKARTFAIKDAWIGAYNAGAAVTTWVEFPLVSDGTLELSTEEATILDGRGRRQATWKHSPAGRVTLRGGEGSMQILEMVTGSGVSSYLNIDSMQFGTEAELTPPSVRLKLRADIKDSADNEGLQYVYCYKAIGQFPSIGMAQTTPGVVEIPFSLNSDTKDHTGATVASAYGRLDFYYTP